MESKPKSRSWPQFLSRDAVWVVGGRLCGVASTVLIALILPRVLDPVSCGQFWLLQTAVELSVLFAVFGIPMALVQLLGRGLETGDRRVLRRTLRSAFQILSVISLVVTLAAVIVVSQIIKNWRIDGSTILLLLAFGVVVIALAWQTTFVESIRGLGDLKWSSLFWGGQMGGAPGGILFCTLLIWTSATGKSTPTSALVAHAVSLCLVLFATILAFRHCWKKNKLTDEQSFADPAQLPFGVPEVAKVSAWIGTTCLFSYVTICAELGVSGYFCSPEEVALLGQSRRLMLIMQLPSQMAVMVMLSSIARLYAVGNLEGVQRLVKRSTMICMLLAGFVALGLLFFPGDIMALLFGEYYRAGAPLVVIATLAQLVIVFTGPAAYVLMMSGHERWTAIASGAAALLTLVLLPLAGTIWGMMGIVGATAMIWVLQSWICWYLCFKTTGVSTNLGFVK